MKIVKVTNAGVKVQVDNRKEAITALDCLQGVRKTDDDFIDRVLDCVASDGIVEDKATKKELKEGGGWERVELDSYRLTDYFAPYVKLIKERTGMDLAPMRLKTVEGIYHTHICEKAYWDGKELTATVSLMVYPSSNWVTSKVETKQRREEKAERNALRFIIEDLGRTQVEPEYLQLRNGLFKRNPSYATGKPSDVTEVIGNDNLWREIWTHWVNNQATEEQKNINDVIYVVSKYSGKVPSTSDYQGMNINNCRNLVSWEEFAKGKDIKIS